MAKFHGKIGYLIDTETDPGIWEQETIEKDCVGNLTRNTSKYQSSGEVNDNIVLSNNITIVADPFAVQNFQHIGYVIYLGVKWKVTNVEIQYPNLILSIGGTYNG